MKFIVFISICALTLTSCFKEEKVALDDPDFLVDLELNLETNGQMFFNLKSRQVVAQNGIYDWDMAFDCRGNKFNVILNSGKAVAAFNTGLKNFSHRFETQIYPWKYDDPCGDLGLTCIGEWGDFSFENPQSYSDVYLLNLGLYGRKTPIGFRKFQFIKFQDSSYVFRFSDLNGKREQTDTIKKDARYNFVYYSFKNGGKQVYIEPAKDNWDIMLGPYLDHARDLGPFDVPVNSELALYDGLTHNRHKHVATIDSVLRPHEISYFEMDQYKWSPFTNQIGNTWNTWSNSDSSYVILQPRTYIVRNEDRYYLINFKGYSKSGQFASKFRFTVKSL
jgi:hypothetical protein